MKAYYIMMHTASDSTPMFWLGLFTWKKSAIDMVELKLRNPTNEALGKTFTVEETFING